MAKSFIHKLQTLSAMIAILLVIIALHKCDAQSVRDCVIEKYTSQIGVRELTGKNDGAEVEKYLASARLGKGNPWCAAFVNWVLKECHGKHNNSGWSPDWFPSDKLIFLSSGKATSERGTERLPLPGDVAGIYFPAKQRIAHVLFIDEAWDPGKSSVRTVEGNTNEAGSREGTSVLRKIRLKKQIYAVSNWIDKTE